MLKSQAERTGAELENLRKRSGEFTKRESELEAAINEMTEESTEKERQEIEKLVNEFTKEKDDWEKEISRLEQEIKELAEKMKEEEQKTSSAGGAGAKTRSKGDIYMNTRTKFFGMNKREREDFFENAEVRGFLERTRELAAQKRTVTGAELLIPTVVLDLIQEQITENSKLYKHVNVKPVPGKARQNVMGTIPEAVWTEMSATLNELPISFTDVEVDGYKVGGYAAVSNAVIEDSDIALAAEIITALGRAIGIALDKAVLYGTGTKMPLGIVTRLTQTAKPGDYRASAREWKDLSTTNVISISSKSDIALYKEIITASGAAKSAYSAGARFWAMNEATHAKLIANALSINSAGAITAGIDNTMPAIGGAIEELNFIPDNVIIGGYGDLYLLAERAGTAISQSEHTRFIQDQTVFKGTARYDGLPVIAEGFVAMDIGGGTVSATAVTFTQDTANSEE